MGLNFLSLGYEEPTVDDSERNRIAPDIWQHRVLILRNHGLIACGRTVPDAWNVMYWLESACKVQMDVLAARREVSLPSHELATALARRYGPSGKLDLAAIEWRYYVAPA